MRTPDYTRRVAITGLGVISPVGNDKQTAWDNLMRGVSGLGIITRFDPSRYEARVAGEVKGFEPTDWLDNKSILTPTSGFRVRRRRRSQRPGTPPPCAASTIPRSPRAASRPREHTAA